MKRKLRIISFILTVAVMFCTFAPFAFVYADSDIDITKTSVREDLASMGKDKLSYVSDQNCIFIAMSQYYDLEGNLRSYVYLNLPTSVNNYVDDLTISISTSVSDENYNITENYEKFRLRYINSEATWYKYEILDLPNLDYTTRRYHIEEIFVVGQAAYLGFQIDEVYIFNGITNDSMQVFNEEIETITITDKEVVFYCHGDSMDFFVKDTGIMNPKDIYTDAWYIFFNTDKKIDELMEIELTYTQYDYHLHHVFIPSVETAVTEEYIEENKSLYPNDYENGKSYVNYHESEITVIEPGTTKVSYTDNKWFGKYDISYENLDNILDLKEYQAQDSDKFIFTDYANKYAWGVHFKDTERFYDSLGNSTSGMIQYYDLDGSGMSDVAILRLKFKTSGIVHNCYAVDVPTDDFTGESAEVDTKFEEWFEKILALVGILVFVVIIGYLLPVFKALFEGLGVILKWILVIISLPFRLIGSLFRTKK